MIMFWKKQTNIECYLIFLTGFILKTGSSFYCSTGNLFISADEFCDGKSDCADGSDEGYGCKPAVCHKGQFACDNDQCVDIRNLCSNYYECADGSDDKYCEKRKPDLKSKTFRCNNGEYIASRRFCDGQYDCHDKSDEGYGCNYNHYSGFTCDTNKPISIENRCNGISDCLDGSDEKYCDHELKLTDCTIDRGKFLCKDELRCIDLNVTCDGFYNCFDGSDENFNCDKYYSISCSSCHHACIRTPEGPHCFYNHSTKIMEEASKDLKDCESDSDCHQKCVIYKNRRYCSCEENFLYNFDTHACIERDRDRNMLIYVTSKEIKAIPGYKKRSITIVEYSEPIFVISAANGHVYWGGIYKGLPAIGKISLQGGKIEILISDDIGEINALDVDWRTGNIYFIDNQRKRLSACTERKQCIEVHKINHIATALSLAPRYGFIFWSTFDEEMGFVIRKSDMNGKNKRPLVKNEVQNVTSMSADETTEKLYWCDGVKHVIEEIDFSGTNRQAFKLMKMNYLAVTVNAGVLYWILTNASSVRYSSSFTSVEQNAISENDPIHLIYGYSYSEKSSNITPPCSWGCEGICLLVSNSINKTGSQCITIENQALENYDSNKMHRKSNLSGLFDFSKFVVLIILFLSFIAIIIGVIFYFKYHESIITICNNNKDAILGQSSLNLELR